MRINHRLKSFRKRRDHRPASRFRKAECRRLRQLEVLEIRTLLSNAALDDLWQSVDEIPASRGGAESYLRTDEFEAFTINVGDLWSAVAEAPLEFTAAAANPIEIPLPTPDGSLALFNIVESPIMAPELAAKYPEIRTYSGTGIDDPTATLRFDITPAGFHAQVLSPNGAYYVDPYYHLEDSLYASYFAAAALDAPEFHEHGIHVEPPSDEKSQSPADESAEGRPGDESGNEPGGESGSEEGKPGPSPQSRSGTELRTYRTAIAADGEYTAFHGGTVALGQAAIVTAINRVTGIYETELSIRLSLVANNDLLVYTDAGTDPYSNTNPSALLTENQTNVDNVIGNANYDLGHVFTTGGGGLAGLGVVGNNSRKAQGETGLANPTGDSFYVDYVAHEIGHQFGGNHTFNGDSGSCAGGNRNASTAYEPGSGSTIQAYANICGNDNLQSSSDPYFHSVSFDEIISYVDNTIPSVGTRTSTGNNVPTVEAGNAFTIPAATSFTLTAAGSDADSGDTLTYNWEQRDLGPQQDVNAGDNGSSPLFRSFTPTTDPTRTFPRLSDLLANTTVIGETLPTTTRAMNFRATVRDGRGGVNTDDTVVNVVDTGASFVVTSPNTAVNLPGNSLHTVTWNVAGTTANGINAANVNILLSTDGGLTFSTVITSMTANDGSHEIVVPNVQTTSARIKVEAVGNIFFDVSNANFTISAIVPGVVAIESASTTNVSEDGLVDTYELSLNTAPTGNVTVTVTSDPQTVVSADGSNFFNSLNLTFNDTTAQTVTVQAIDDGLIEGLHTGTITHAITATADAGDYPLATSINDVTANIADNELAAFERLEPLGGLTFRSDNNSGSLANGSDQADFSFFAEAGQTISAIADPASNVTLSIELVGVSGTIAGPSAGAAVVMPPQTISSDATYVLRVTGDGASDFTLEAFRNAALETQIGNTADGSELNIDNSFVSLGSGRYGVVGSAEPVVGSLGFTQTNNAGLFVDISGTGTALNLGDDDEVTITTTVGNSVFPSGSVRIGNNGVIIAGTSGNVPFENLALPTTGFGNALVPYWDDISETAGNVFWEERQVGGIDTLIVQWEDRPHFDVDGSNVTFQVQLFATGPVSVRYAYQDVTFGNAGFDGGASATIGYQESTSSAIQFSINSASLSNGDVLDLASPITPDVDEYEVD